MASLRTLYRTHPVALMITLGALLGVVFSLTSGVAKPPQQVSKPSAYPALPKEAKTAPAAAGLSANYMQKYLR